MKRIYNAVCELLEAKAQNLRTGAATDHEPEDFAPEGAFTDHERSALYEPDTLHIDSNRQSIDDDDGADGSRHFGPRTQAAVERAALKRVAGRIGFTGRNQQ